MSENKEANSCEQELVLDAEEKEAAVDGAEAAGAGAASETEVERLLALVEEKNQLVNEQIDRFKRLQADFENFKRRTRQEKEELSNIVAQNILVEILPVIDNFERALQSAAAQDAASVLAGVQMIYRQFAGVMDKVGLTAIEAVGKPFDPQQHEAVMRVEDPEQPDGTIAEELQKGYSVRGKVIRPSMVKVVSN
ncbi:nucleotide exchange factor GrpE [Propionispora vibrioides]|uniref:Protein GrpE n=1 Tax=Propionispora vibrioides TaxID=112903 RepID=A0A1H8NUL6_9FIRM|nr:nucleotide exchange factor GrpE [Propionispora vibrioides]SEO33038.1 molecular chaperone GrpE [Propionispora vibrioides]